MRFASLLLCLALLGCGSSEVITNEQLEAEIQLLSDDIDVRVINIYNRLGRLQMQLDVDLEVIRNDIQYLSHEMRVNDRQFSRELFELQEELRDENRD